MSLDVIGRLKIDIEGIEKDIKAYDKDSPALTKCFAIKQAIRDSDKDVLLFCLNELQDWYSENLQFALQAANIMRPNEHKSNMNKINNYIAELENYDFETKKKVIKNKNEEDNPIIFLSHSSSDKKYGDIIESFLMGLGLKKEQLIYSSHPLHKIPLDSNIYEYLRKNINRDIFMIILWSDKYLESPACLNEMGAAWVVQCDYTNFYVPSFQFGNPKYHECAVDTRKMGSVLNGDENCKQNMIEFKDKIINMFHLKIDEKETAYLLDNFCKQLQEIE